MKYIAYVIFLFCVLNNSVYCQVDTINYKPHSSIKEERVEKTNLYKDGRIVKSKNKKRKTKYIVDGNKSNEKKYELANKTSKTIDVCKPCWLRYYDENGYLLQEGFSYSDCALGKRTEYYKSKKIKTIRYYKENKSNEWKDFPCSVAEGTWTYFNEDGTIEKYENYKDGQLIK